MSQATTCPERADLGVYLVGALSSAERWRLEAHLPGCRGCQAELAEIAGVPGMLAAVPASVAIGLLDDDISGTPAGRRSDEPPPEVLATVRALRSARRRRRAGLGAVLAAAATALIGAGVAAGTAISGPVQAAGQTGGQSYGTPAGAWQTAVSQSRAPGATVMYRQMGWGTQLQAKVSGIPPGTRCQMTVLTAAGPELIAGSWVTDADAGTVWYPASADVRTADIRSVVITAGSLQPVTVYVHR